jgi:hypothetical protein
VPTLLLGDARDPRDRGLETLARRAGHVRYAARPSATTDLAVLLR